MVRNVSFLAAAMFAVASPSSGSAAGPTSAQAVAAIEAYAPRALKEQGAPGMSVVITDASHTLQTLTLGYANVDAKLPVTERTRFPIGSITKSMTALSLMQLVDAGRLGLEEPVRAYLPEFEIDSGGKAIEVHQLLSHTAGIPDDYSVPDGYGDAIYNLKDASLLFAPGTGFSYSNDGFATAGALLARLDEKPWPDVVQTRVFDVLDMTHTSPVFTSENMSDAAVGYAIRDNDVAIPNDPPLVPAPSLDFVAPSGSVISTPADMGSYMRFYLRGGTTPSGNRVLSQRLFDRMTSPDTNGTKIAGDPKPEMNEAPEFYRRYGFGLSISNDGGDHVIEHTGGFSGYTACMEMNLTRGFGVTAMSNLVEAPLHPCAIVRYAMRVLRAQSLGQPLPPAPAPPDRAAIAHAADFVGTFTPATGHAISFMLSGSGLSLHDDGSTFGVFRRDDDTFWTDDPRFARYLLLFHRDEKKRVSDVTWGDVEFAGPEYRESQSYPAGYAAFVGRYETEAYLSQSVTRVLIVHGKLTFDGLTPLVDQGNGTFLAGKDLVRFDHIFGGKAQRMRFDDIETTRIELP